MLDRKFFNQTFGVSNAEELEDDLESHLHTFENLCKNKVLDMNLSPTKLVQINQFIDIVDRVNNRYPFLFIPSFIQDFMGGHYSRALLKKYHLRNFLELNYIIEHILKIKGKRVKGFTSDTLNKNLEHPSWKKIYDVIVENSLTFNDELFEILNQNLLRAFTIIALYNHPNGLTKDELVKNFPNVFETNQHRISLFSENEKIESFTKYISEDLSQKIEHVLESLENKKFIREDFNEKRFYLEPKYVKIDKAILSILSQNQEGIHYDRFHRALLREIEILKLVPKVGLWEDVLTNLEKSKVKRVTTFWRYSPYRDQLFLQEDFDKKIKEMRNQIVAAGRTKFFGRRISPQNFITELVKLEKGDLDDADDQVTRLAGLVLADSIFLQTPHENMEEFDFAVDISNYEFRPQQIKAMKSVNFSIVGKIIHCKLMINESLELSLIEEIKKKIPTGHQAVIFTLMEIPDSIKRILPEDKTIQIVGEDGIKAWLAITPVIPCRVGSIAKIMYGDLRGKIVRINSINYESGIASITTVVNGETHSVYVGSLKEIWFGDIPDEKFYEYQNNYAEFLNFLLIHGNDKEAFQSVFIEPVKSVKVNIRTKSSDNVTKTEIIDPIKEQIASIQSLSSKIKREYEWVFEVSGNKPILTYNISQNTVSLPLDYTTKNSIMKFLKCDCLLYKEQAYDLKLCSHLMVALNFLATRMNQFGHSWENDTKNIIRVMMQNFEKLNKRTIIDYVAGWFNGAKFEEFIQILKDLKCQDNSGNINTISNIAALKEKLIDEFDSNELSESFDKMIDTVSTMNHTVVSSIILDLKRKNWAEERRRKI